MGGLLGFGEFIWRRFGPGNELYSFTGATDAL